MKGHWFASKYSQPGFILLTHPLSELHTHDFAADEKELQFLLVPPQVPCSSLKGHKHGNGLGKMENALETLVKAR